MTPTPDVIVKKAAKLAKAAGVDLTGITFTSGPVGAPVMMVGWQHGLMEKIPFSSVNRSMVRAVLAQMHVDQFLVSMTNLIKSHTPDVKSGDKLINPWVHLLAEEIAIHGPKSVILMGLETANAFLGMDAKTIDVLRGYRFADAKTGISYFVTHCVDDIDFRERLASATTVEWHDDVRAVFEVNRSYFTRIKVI